MFLAVTALLGWFLSSAHASGPDRIIRKFNQLYRAALGALQLAQKPDGIPVLSPRRDAFPLLLVLAVYMCYTLLFFGIVQIDIDIGRDFVLPDLLLQGKTLYRDVQCWFGPFTPWLHYWLFRSFGPSTTVILVAGSLAGLGIVLLTYLLAREILAPGVSALAALIVLTQAVYSPQIFAYATPYTFAATYGLFFSILTLYASCRALDQRYSHWDVLTSGAMALALACKQEFVLICLLIVSAALCFRFYPDRRGLLPAALVQVASCGAVLALMAYFLFSQVSVAEFLANVYPRQSIRAWRYFYGNALGWGPKAWSNTADAVSGLVLNFGFILSATSLLLSLFSLASGRRPSKKLLLAAAATLFFLWHLRGLQYYPLLLHAIVLAFLASGRAPAWRAKTAFLTLCAAIFLLRILPYPIAIGYGLFYFVPSLLVYFFLCYRIAGPYLMRLFPEARVEVAISAVMVLFFIIPQLLNNNLWAQNTERIETERGILRLRHVEAAKAKVVLEQIRRYSSPGDKILLVPEGALYYFLSDRQPASRHLSFIYGYIPDGAAELAEVQRLEASLPKLIVWDDLPQELYIPGPVNTFGAAYNVQLGRWIQENYTEIHVLPYRNRQVHFLIPKRTPPQ